MNAIDFCFWLQGYFEIGGNAPDAGLTGQQVRTIRNHLALVFKHEIDPLREGQTPASKEELDVAHTPPSWSPPPTMRC